jgi:hypothetical protein
VTPRLGAELSWATQLRLHSHSSRRHSFLSFCCSVLVVVVRYLGDRGIIESGHWAVVYQR